MEVSAITERVSKRQKVSTTWKQYERTPTESTVSSSAVPQYQPEDKLTTPLSKEQRRSLWLAVLTPEERQAGGVNWHSTRKSNICFSCKQPGDFLSCSSCPRSYHPACVPLGHEITTEDWACPACAILDSEDRLEVKTTGRLTEPVLPASTRSSEETMPSEPLETTILVDGPQLKATNQRGAPKEISQKTLYQGAHSKKEKHSSSVGITNSPPKFVQIISDSDNIQPNKPRRIKLPDPSTDVSATKFIQAHPETVHRHDSSSSKPEQNAAKKRSRYSTLPSEVDEALAIINRQLEIASHSKSMLEQATTRLHILEQDLVIERGKGKLTANQSEKDAEVAALRDELKLKQDIINDLTKRNEKLSEEVGRRELRIKELEAWKMRMRTVIDGD